MTTDSNHSALLAFDIGLKRTGVASGHTFTKTANPAQQLKVKNGRLDWHELDKLIEEWQPSALIIGDPKTDDPSLNKVINRFKSYVQQHHKIPIHEVDETLTSSSANSEMSKQGLSLEKKIELRDQIAACLILESFFSSLK